MHLIKKNPLEENLGVVNFEGINVFNLKHLWVAYNGLLSSTGIEVRKKNDFHEFLSRRSPGLETFINYLKILY